MIASESYSKTVLKLGIRAPRSAYFTSVDVNCR
jgi:hypothetical protein